jgi:hypothetical protein
MQQCVDGRGKGEAIRSMRSIVVCTHQRGLNIEHQLSSFKLTFGCRPTCVLRVASMVMKRMHE